MNAVIGIIGVVAILFLVGAGLGLLDRKQFSARWLLVATGLVILNDFLLTNGYRLIPNIIGGEWNWQGKLLALAATLAVAGHPAFGWKRSGLTLSQKPGSLKPAILVAIPVMALFTYFALSSDEGGTSVQTFAFQLTMPGLEEEPFYRGVLLFALNEAFRGRFQALGVEWGWGALLACALFGMVHAFGYGDGGFAFDPMTFALTAIPSLIVVWLRERTGSLLLPILLHNFGNSIGLFV